MFKLRINNSKECNLLYIKVSSGNTIKTLGSKFTFNSFQSIHDVPQYNMLFKLRTIKCQVVWYDRLRSNSHGSCHWSDCPNWFHNTHAIFVLHSLPGPKRSTNQHTNILWSGEYIKHEYLRSRAYICLSLSSPFSPVIVSQIWPLSRYSCCYLGSLHPRNFHSYFSENLS